MVKKFAFMRTDCQRNIYVILIVSAIILSGLTYNFIYKFQRLKRDFRSFNRISLNVNDIPEKKLPDSVDKPKARRSNCSIWTCIDPYRCGRDRITIYVYPLVKYVNANYGTKIAAPLTKEFYQILDTIVKSPYYTSNPNEACLFVPSIDLINQNRIHIDLVNKVLVSLEYWNNGKNHVLFNMLAGSYPTFNTVIDVNTDHAVIVGGGFNSWSYRRGFDVSIPVWSPLLKNHHTSLALKDSVENLLVVGQINILPKLLWTLQSLLEKYPNDILLLKQCNKRTVSTERCLANDENVKFSYPSVLSKGTFCLLGASVRLGQPDLLEMLAFNCIPLIVVDAYVLPFEDVIDWSLASIRIRESDLHLAMEKVKNISSDKIQEMKRHGRLLFNNYFNSLRTLTMTTLEYLQSRIFPYNERNKKHWNFVDNSIGVSLNPLFLSRVVSRTDGFTAVILTYDRLESLFNLIEKLSSVPSLHAILVVWNNQLKSPPLLSSFPVISRPIKIIKTRNNRLSNRFFPYKEIETEAMLTIDDDINMLTDDEVDFGYEVWREFPDRIVGFPSRLHVWENLTSHWRYESEWTNQISMVLTGAAFHHKYWSHMYTYRMPDVIREIVDSRMNCEDIAMNFLVSNITNKPPIKVTPRKKFKCPECANNEMLSADLNHMRERSRCIDEFSNIFGRMPLHTIEFRADPVLFKDNFPEKLKRFSDMGTL